ncbi:MAG: hypothetical protein ACLU98_03340 [Desulfovibrio fairfieldensis]
MPYVSDDPAGRRRVCPPVVNFTTRSTSWISTPVFLSRLLSERRSTLRAAGHRGLAAMLERGGTAPRPGDHRRARALNTAVLTAATDGAMVFLDEAGTLSGSAFRISMLQAPAPHPRKRHPAPPEPDYLRYKARQNTRSLVFEWRTGRSLCGRRDSRLLAGSYDGRHLLTSGEDSVLFPEDRPMFGNFQPWPPAILQRGHHAPAPQGGRIHLVRARTRIDNRDRRALCGQPPGCGQSHPHRAPSRQQAEYDDLTGACTMPTFWEKPNGVAQASDAPAPYRAL